MTIKSFSLTAPLASLAVAICATAASLAQMPTEGFPELQALQASADEDSVPLHRRLTDTASEKFKE